MRIRGGVKEIHFGKVLSNDDPAKAGGLKVQVDTLVDGAQLSDEFIPPTFPFAGNDEGFFFVPEKGALVEVEVRADPETATENLDARWRAVLYTDKDAVPAEFASDPVNRGGIKFGKGKILLFDKAKDLLALISANVRLGEEAASHPLMRGDTYNTQLSTYLQAEDAFLTLENTLMAAINTQLGTWNSLPPATPVLSDVLKVFATGVIAALTPYITGIATFKAANASFAGAKTTWLSTKCKTE